MLVFMWAPMPTYFFLYIGSLKNGYCKFISVSQTPDSVPPTGTCVTQGPSQNMALNLRPPNFLTQYSILKYLLKPKQLFLLLTFKSQTKVICPISNPGDRWRADSSISRAKTVGYGFSKGENTVSFGLDLSLYMKMNHSIKKKN